MKIEEVEKSKNYDNFYGKSVVDPFKTIAEYRKVRELLRKINIEDIKEPEITRSTTKISYPTTRAMPKLRKFIYKTNMQARKHITSDEFRLGFY